MSFFEQILSKVKLKTVIMVMILVFVVPLLIYIIFSIPSKFEWMGAVLSAGDFLQYYGSVLGAALSIYGVYLTIDYTQKNYLNDKRLSKLPFLSIDVLQYTAGKSPKDINKAIKDSLWSQSSAISKNTDFVFKVSPGRNEANPITINVLSSNCSDVLQSDTVKEGKSILFIPIQIENVGDGVALDVELLFYRIETDRLCDENCCVCAGNGTISIPKDVSIKKFKENIIDKKNIQYNLKNGSTSKLFFIFDKLPQDFCWCQGEYHCDIFYRNVFGEAYFRRVVLLVSYDKLTQLYEAAVLNIEKEKIYDENGNALTRPDFTEHRQDRGIIPKLHHRNGG